MGTSTVGPLNDDSFGLDRELSVFLLFGGLRVVAGVDADFDLCVQPGIDFRSGIDAGSSRGGGGKCLNRMGFFRSRGGGGGSIVMIHHVGFQK